MALCDIYRNTVSLDRAAVSTAAKMLSDAIAEDDSAKLMALLSQFVAQLLSSARTRRMSGQHMARNSDNRIFRAITLARNLRGVLSANQTRSSETIGKLQEALDKLIVDECA